MKIATLTDGKGNTLAFGESGIVRLYDLDENGWKCLHEVTFNLDEEIDLSNIRKYIYGLVSQLAGCELFVMKKSPGIFNVIFEEELGIKIRALDGIPFELLSQIYKEEMEKVESERSMFGCSMCGNNSATTIWPIPVGGIESGLFQINMVEVQQKNCSLNSREILLPFLEQKKSFIELEIICMHVPKWLNNVLDSLSMELVVEEWEDGFCHAFVYRSS